MLARALFETTTSARWLLAPSQPFNREVQWLRHLEEEERLWERLAKHARESGVNHAKFSSQAQQIHSFRTAVESRLLTDVMKPAGTPSVQSALAELGVPQHHMHYILLSQFTHGNHNAGGFLRTGLGNKKELEEVAPLGEWLLLLKMTWWCLQMAAVDIVQVACNLRSAVVRDEPFTAFSEAVVAL